MANISSNPQFDKGRWLDRLTLLRNATGSVNGEWVRLSGQPWSVTLGGTISAGSVSILVSNQEAQPTDYAWPVLETYSALTAKVYDSPWVWIAAITTGVTGSVKVDVKVEAAAG